MSAPHGVAVVTGASSGIGQGFARHLAAEGRALVLVARRRDRLEALAAELTATHGTRCHVVVADLSDPRGPAAVVTAVHDAGLSADVLVNAAGFGTNAPVLHEPPAGIAAEVMVDVLAPTLLTRLLLPDLLGAAGGGVLVNVSSTASFQPLPTAAVYGACKAYLSSFTEALWHEHLGDGLRVVNLCPGPTETEFFVAAGSEKFKVGLVPASTEQVVRAAAAHLRRRDPGPTVVVGTVNRLNAIAARLAPRRFTLAVTASKMKGPR